MLCQGNKKRKYFRFCCFDTFTSRIMNILLHFYNLGRNIFCNKLLRSPNYKTSAIIELDKVTIKHIYSL